jgi:hypothetical protein
MASILPLVQCRDSRGCQYPPAHVLHHTHMLRYLVLLTAEPSIASCVQQDTINYCLLPHIWSTPQSIHLTALASISSISPVSKPGCLRHYVQQLRYSPVSCTPMPNIMFMI